MNLERRAWNISRLAALLLLIVSLRVVYWQMIRGDELQPVAISPIKAASDYARIRQEQAENTEQAVDFLKGGGSPVDLETLPQPVIQRTRDVLKNIQRGAIYDRNGRLLASDRLDEDGNYFRFYTEPSLAPVIGYVSGLRTGVTGLEQTYNVALLGLNRPDAQIDQILHKPVTGNDVVLTIDSVVQRAAENALEGRPGAVIAVDAHTGAVLAIASTPFYDPNRILEAGYANELLAACGENPACQAPFLNRATQALYPPGSTWKTVSLIAALDTGQIEPDTVFDFGDPVQGPNGPYFVYEVDGGIIPDPNHREDRLELPMAYARSANAAFARIGDEMPPETMIQYGARFGYGAPGEIIFPFELDVVPSQIASDPQELYENNLLRAVTAIGQGELLTTPFNLSLVALAVMNEGDLPLPYFVQSIREPSGRVIENLPNRRTLTNLMSARTASQVKAMMITASEKGSGQSARVPGVVTGGKTGTAQVGGDRPPHAWFFGFGEKGDRAVVVVAMLENTGEGSRYAGPIFGQVVEAAINSPGAAVEEVVPTPLPPPPTVTPGAPPAGETAQPQGQGIQSADGETTPQQEGPPAVTVPAPDLPLDRERIDSLSGSPACSPNQDAPLGTGQWAWPAAYQLAEGGEFGAGHPGLDLDLPTGSPVSAADSGFVLFAGWAGAEYGNAVLVDHGNGFQTLYAQLSQVSIACGAPVGRGQVVGLSGDTGNSPSPRLHFEVRVPGGAVDPLKVLPTP